jgi:SAM-dependent methyltransferase
VPKDPTPSPASLQPAKDATQSRMDLNDLFREGKWYHCIRHEGLVSNGTYDIEKYLKHYGFDDDYSDRSVLDVGCADGFFSLLMKQRGAERVCGIDSNKYDGSVAIDAARFNSGRFAQKYQAYADDFVRFADVYEQYGLTNSNKLLLMARLKSLNVEYHTGTAYDLSAYGCFDVVLCNDLLEHLRDPITAIEQVYLATRNQAVFSVSAALEPTWLGRDRPMLLYKGDRSGGSFYSLSAAAVCAMCRAAGFRESRVVSRYKMENRRDRSPSYHCVIHAHR